eukprot:TRINITY_DN60668_c0_g1_i1.p1 TRINITY_DN60668_c0_g1~~TRINITY_DN60668_c0_g1_i1.p1  ORF type:complete len:363 (-),score=66.14 TRINITY_DN60668_c0_g1_i1:126-1214(-)
MIMKKLFEAALRHHGDRAADGGPRSELNGILLPQQTEDQLVLSEVHSRLDRTLYFLQREIGYSLLEDAHPTEGGGISLQLKPCDRAGEGVARGANSSRMPQVRPEEDSGEASIAKVASQLAPCLGRLTASSEVIRYTPDCAKYAHYPDDLVLVWRFAWLVAEMSPSVEKKVKRDQFFKTMLQGVRLLHLCDYHYSDVVITLAYAAVYFKGVHEVIGQQMSEPEVAHVCVLLLYLAHSFILDETCPLRCWQKHIFKKYCNLKVLDAALFRLLRVRNYNLRITEEEERFALSVLLCSTEPHVVLDLAAGKSKGSSRTSSEISSNGSKPEKAVAQPPASQPRQPAAPQKRVQRPASKEGTQEPEA